MSKSSATVLPGIRSLFPGFDETETTSSPPRPQPHNAYPANRPLPPYPQQAPPMHGSPQRSSLASSFPQHGQPRLLSAFPPEIIEDDGSKDGRRHTCPHCHKRFNRPSSLKIHINTHTGAKPFECPFPGCGRQFNVSSNMRRHYRNHASGSHMASLEMEHDMPRLQHSSEYVDAYGMPFSPGMSPSSSAYSTPSPRTRAASIGEMDPRHLRDANHQMPESFHHQGYHHGHTQGHPQAHHVQAHHPQGPHHDRQFRNSYPYPPTEHRGRSQSTSSNQIAYQRIPRQPPNPQTRSIVPTSSLLGPHSSTQTPMYSYPPPPPPNNNFTSNAPANFPPMNVTLPPAPSARISMPMTL